MSNESDYEKLLPQIIAIADEDARAPLIPVSVALQEAENLHHWAHEDRDQLLAAGLDAALLDELPTRAGACREAESRWVASRFTRDQAQEAYLNRSTGAFALADEVVHHMFYAYRDRPDLLDRLRPIAQANTGSGPARIQSLSNLAVFGKAHPEPLEATGFNLAMLEVLARASDELGEMFAVARGERAGGKVTKLVRDKAFTHLRQAMDEVRACGRFLFWRDERRLRGYRSEYKRRHRGQAGDESLADESNDATSASPPFATV